MVTESGSLAKTTNTMETQDRALGSRETAHLRYALPDETPVDIWSICLTRQNEEVQHYRHLLSFDEVRRADRFYFENHRNAFIVAHTALRQILSLYAGCAPREVAFSYGFKGKPDLSNELQKCGIRFNLSHSGDIALLAVARGASVGVDIELINSKFATDEVADRFFAAGETRRLGTLPPNERVDAFYACWTRKEAYVKALGDGLHEPLDSFEVTFGPGVPADLLLVKKAPGKERRWRLYDIGVRKGYRAALVVEGGRHRLSYRYWA
jgi:4'-phosphopantetheinyl transferase